MFFCVFCSAFGFKNPLILWNMGQLLNCQDECDFLFRLLYPNQERKSFPCSSNIYIFYILFLKSQSISLFSSQAIEKPRLLVGTRGAVSVEGPQNTFQRGPVPVSHSSRLSLGRESPSTGKNVTPRWNRPILVL